MLVTINTDASYAKFSQRGSYAFWITSNLGKITRYGVFKKKMNRPEVAEFMCIINAVYSLSISSFTGVSKVIVNTDCLNVIHLLNGDDVMIRRYNLNSWGKHYVKIFNDMVNSSSLKGVTIEYRHVKAHTSTASRREWVNEWCDKYAKAALKDYLVKHKLWK